MLQVIAPHVAAITSLHKLSRLRSAAPKSWTSKQYGTRVVRYDEQPVWQR